MGKLGRYTGGQRLRFPLVFGGTLGMLTFLFMCRKLYFKEEIEAVRQHNYEEHLRRTEEMEKAKAQVEREMAARK